MSQTAEVDVVLPSARRLITSLRDVGYNFATAVADLVDNSIEAGATQVDICVEFNGEDSWVRIVDNGKGMSPEELLEAMRYGSEREYNERDLGKFGLGLKTASLSQCKRLTVASRSNSSSTNLVARCWDLEHIDRENRWEVLRLNDDELEPRITSPLRVNTGTVVLWERLDRILGYKHPYGEPARKRLTAMCRDLESHLGMVFHRFIMGVEGRQVRITINDNEVAPWDPFARDEPKTRILPTTEIQLEYGGIHGTVLFEPYILPHKDDFTSQEAFRRASGPNNWNQQQGFYIYRAGRLVQSGGWSRLRTIDEHTKLARIALRFSPALDEAFKVNVAKMHVQLPAQTKGKIRELLEPIIKIALEVYRKNPATPSTVQTYRSTQDANPLTQVKQVAKCNNSPPGTQVQMISTQTRLISPTISVSRQVEARTDDTENPIKKYWTLDEIFDLLVDSAEPEELPVIEQVFNRLRRSLNTSRREK